MIVTQSQTVRCPNCGSVAERRYFHSSAAIYSSCPRCQVIQTECPSCDYLMAICSGNGSVVEAAGPGIPVLSHLN